MPQREKLCHPNMVLLTVKVTTVHYVFLNTAVFYRNISQMKPNKTPGYILYFATDAYQDKIIIYFSNW